MIFWLMLGGNDGSLLGKMMSHYYVDYIMGNARGNDGSLLGNMMAHC